jgi:hypothetical protein
MVGTDDATARLFSIDLRWLLMILMVVALRDAKVFGANWLVTAQLSPVVESLLESLRTPDLQWVNPPFGEHTYIEPATRLDLKLSSGFRTWRWHDRPSPEPVRVLEINKIPPDMITRLKVAGIPLYEAGPGREYAAMTQTDGGRSICLANGVGGYLAVRCNAPREGALVVKENSWSGWRAWVDGQPATLLPGRWLSVEISGGDHTVEFRYLPWDVPLGLLLALAGIALALSCWFKPDSYAVWPDLTPPAPPTPS